MSSFDSTSAIYLQIADLMCEKILTGEWAEDERIPSIRDIAGLVQVNPNTVVRSFAHLQDKNVIFNKRGVGYFVTSDGKKRVKALKREHFIESQLPRVFREADLLSVTTTEMASLYQQYLGEKS